MSALANRVLGKRNRHPNLSQAVALRELVYQAAQQPDLEPNELARLVHAWSEVQERLRIIRGKPMPGFLRPELGKKPRRQIVERSEPIIATIDDISATDSAVNE
jgi:hypothetical protein